MARVWSVVVVALVSLLVCAGGASAAVIGLESQSAAGVMDSVSSKSATVTCPGGKQATGVAGFKTHAAFGEVRLLAARPSSDLKSAVASFREDETGFAGSWQATAFALCAPLPGLQRVVQTTASSSAAKNVTATCPSGKRLVGLGGETNGGSGQVVIDVMRPNSGLTAATVAAREDQTGFAGSWTVTAYAICAPGPQGLQRVSAAGQVTAGGPDVVADCPAGKGLLGVGGEASGQSGQVSLETYAIPGTGEPTRAVARGFEDQDGYAPNWTLTAYAICANTAERRVAEVSGSSAVAVGGACPSGRVVTGGGGDVSGGRGEVALTGVDFDPNSPGVFQAAAHEDDDGFANTWSLRVYGICSTPLPGLELVFASSNFDSSTVHSVTASCPTGKKVVGGGGAVLFGPDPSGLVLEQFVPNAALTTVRAVGQEDEDFYADQWNVTAYAICANPPAGLQLVSDASEPDSDDASARASCPTGKHLLGTAGGTSFGAGQVVLDDLRPDAALKTVTATGQEDQNGYGTSWNVVAYAICANH